MRPRQPNPCPSLRPPLTTRLPQVCKISGACGFNETKIIGGGEHDIPLTQVDIGYTVSAGAGGVRQGGWRRLMDGEWQRALLPTSRHLASCSGRVLTAHCRRVANCKPTHSALLSLLPLPPVQFK